MLNKLTNVIPLNVAGHSIETKVKVYEPGIEQGFTIYNTIMTDRITLDNQNYVEVKAKTLDSVLREIGVNHVNWIKIDVEGAELEVLRGAPNTLLNSSIHLY